MDAETQAVLFNAVPLLVLAALYLTVGVALAPALWRERRRLGSIGAAMALLYPSVGLAAAILGVSVLADREPLAGHVWLSYAALALAAIPAASPAAASPSARSRPSAGRRATATAK